MNLGHSYNDYIKFVSIFATDCTSRNAFSKKQGKMEAFLKGTRLPVTICDTIGGNRRLRKGHRFLFASLTTNEHLLLRVLRPFSRTSRREELVKYSRRSTYWSIVLETFDFRGCFSIFGESSSGYTLLRAANPGTKLVPRKPALFQAKIVSMVEEIVSAARLENSETLETKKGIQPLKISEPLPPVNAKEIGTMHNVHRPIDSLRFLRNSVHRWHIERY